MIVIAESAFRIRLSTRDVTCMKNVGDPVRVIMGQGRMTRHPELHLRQELIDSFAAASGDHNSLHTDAGFTRRAWFRQPVAHGLRQSRASRSFLIRARRRFFDSRKRLLVLWNRLI